MRKYIIILVVILTLNFTFGLYKVTSNSMLSSIKKGDIILVNKISYSFNMFAIIPLIKIPIFHLLLNGIANVKRGDVVLFNLPKFRGGKPFSGERVLVKRCIGLPGDSLTIIGNHVFSNNLEIKFHSVINPTIENDGSFDTINYRIPQNGDKIIIDSITNKFYKDLILGEECKIVLNDSGNLVLNEQNIEKYIIKKNYYFMMGDNREFSKDSRSWGFVSEDNIIGKIVFIF